MKRIPLPVIQQFIPESNPEVLPTSASFEMNQSQMKTHAVPENLAAATMPVNGEKSPHSSFFHDVKEIQGLPQLLLRERSCQLLLLLLHQRK